MQEIVKRLFDYDVALQIKKDNDYGNSFDKAIEKYGVITVCMRLDDKISRLEQIMAGNHELKTETVFDTVLDTMNYAILALRSTTHRSFSDILNEVLENTSIEHVDISKFREIHNELLDSIKNSLNSNEILFTLAKTTAGECLKYFTVNE